MILSIGRRYKSSLPEMLNELIDEVMTYNSNRIDFSYSTCFRCVSLAFNGTKLLSLGYNKHKTHPFTKNYHDLNRMSIHAEADMVMDLIKRNKINKVTDVIVIRGSHQPLSSRPCTICRGLLEMYLPSIRVWWYDDVDQDWKVEISERMVLAD